MARSGSQHEGDVEIPGARRIPSTIAPTGRPAGNCPSPDYRSERSREIGLFVVRSLLLSPSVERIPDARKQSRRDGRGRQPDGWPREEVRPKAFPSDPSVTRYSPL